MCQFTPLTLSALCIQAEDGIRDPLWSRGLGDVYKRQGLESPIIEGDNPVTKNLRTRLICSQVARDTRNLV